MSYQNLVDQTITTSLNPPKEAEDGRDLSFMENAMFKSRKPNSSVDITIEMQKVKNLATCKQQYF